MYSWKITGKISPYIWREVKPMFFNCLQMKLQPKGPREPKKKKKSPLAEVGD